MTELERACYWDTLAGNIREVRDIDDPKVTLYMDLIAEEMRELADAYAESDRLDMLDALGDIMKVVAGTIHVMGYCPEKLLKVINDSNFTKFTDDEYIAAKSADAYNSQARYVDVRYEKRGDLFVIIGCENVGNGMARNTETKVLKNIYYTPATAGLQKMIEEG